MEGAGGRADVALVRPQSILSLLPDPCSRRCLRNHACQIEVDAAELRLREM